MNPPKTPSLVAATLCQYEKLRSYLIRRVTVREARLPNGMFWKMGQVFGVICRRLVFEAPKRRRARPQQNQYR